MTSGTFAKGIVFVEGLGTSAEMTESEGAQVNARWNGRSARGGHRSATWFGFPDSKQT